MTPLLPWLLIAAALCQWVLLQMTMFKTWFGHCRLLRFRPVLGDCVTAVICPAGPHKAAFIPRQGFCVCFGYRLCTLMASIHVSYCCPVSTGLYCSSSPIIFAACPVRPLGKCPIGTATSGHSTALRFLQNQWWEVRSVCVAHPRNHTPLHQRTILNRSLRGWSYTSSANQPYSQAIYPTTRLIYVQI